MSYTDILDKILDSKDTSVGGDAASALAGAMACGLLGMVARLSIMGQYGLDDHQFIKLAEELDGTSFRLLRGSQEDVKAYASVCDALKLPHGTREEEDDRLDRIQETGERAAEIARDNGYLCKRVHRIGLILRGNSNTNVATDLEVGITLAQVGIDGAIGTMKSSLPLIKDKEFRKALQNDINELSKEDKYYEDINGRSEH